MTGAGAARGSTRILGLSIPPHDPAAAILVDGVIVAAAREARFTPAGREEHFPRKALAHCLGEAGLGAADLDFVGLHGKPRARFDRMMEASAAFAPRGLRTYLRTVMPWIRSGLGTASNLAHALGGRYPGRFAFASHAESLAAGAFFRSPFEEAAILVIDAAGEWATTAMGSGRGNRVRLTHEIRFPHSLALLEASFARYTGLPAEPGPQGLRAAAAAGEPRFREVLLREVVDVREDGSFWLDMRCFRLPDSVATTARFDALFGGPAREAGAPPTARENDLAASLYSVYDEVVLRCARELRRVSGASRLVLAGSTGGLPPLPFDDVWSPAADEPTGAIGAAQVLWHHVLAHARGAH